MNANLGMSVGSSVNDVVLPLMSPQRRGSDISYSLAITPVVRLPVSAGVVLKACVAFGLRQEEIDTPQS